MNATVKTLLGGALIVGAAIAAKATILKKDTSSAVQTAHAQTVPTNNVHPPTQLVAANDPNAPPVPVRIVGPVELTGPVQIVAARPIPIDQTVPVAVQGTVGVRAADGDASVPVAVMNLPAQPPAVAVNNPAGTVVVQQTPTQPHTADAGSVAANDPDASAPVVAENENPNAQSADAGSVIAASNPDAGSSITVATNPPARVVVNVQPPPVVAATNTADAGPSFLLPEGLTCTAGNVTNDATLPSGNAVLVASVYFYGHGALLRHGWNCDRATGVYSEFTYGPNGPTADLRGPGCMYCR